MDNLVNQTLQELQECMARQAYLLTLLAGALDAEQRKPFFVPSLDETMITQ